MPRFAPILAAAEARHGVAGVAARLAVPRTATELRALGDDRYLSLMSRRVFRAGLKHELVDAKWPAFEEAWHGFDPARCARVWDEEVETMLADRRLIRHLGNSAPNFLRMAGKDTFILTDSVSNGLVHWGAAPSAPTSRAAQAVFNAWAIETGRPLCQISLSLALSFG